MQRPGESQPAPVGERRDDQPRRAAQVLVAVREPGIALGDVAQHLFFVPFILQMSEKYIFKAQVIGAKLLFVCVCVWFLFFFFKCRNIIKIKNKILVENIRTNEK